MEHKQHNRRVIRNANRGDLLEFHRGLYSHWAVYIGDEEIVHLAGEDNDGINNVKSKHVFTICGKTFNKAMVKRENVWSVVLDCKVEINNNKDRKCTPLPAEKIVEEALLKLGKIGYNVLWDNCEHFAAYCRYGVKWSEQADNFLWGVTVAAGAITVAALMKNLFLGEKEEKEEKK